MDVITTSMNKRELTTQKNKYLMRLSFQIYGYYFDNIRLSSTITAVLSDFYKEQSNLCSILSREKRILNCDQLIFHFQKRQPQRP